MIDDLLLLARRDAGHRARRHQPIDMDELVMTDVRRQRPMTPAIEIDVREVSAAPVLGDGDEIGRAIRNLVSNASRHARHRVAIALVTRDDRVVLTVEDDGPGVDPELREHVFERFARADPARARPDGGTGLGLAITRELAEAHDGIVHVDESPSLGGARFTIELPAFQSD